MSLLTNETINHILDRRSIRAYKPEAIPADVVETLLTAAVHAPTARNSQPWQFIVVDDRAQLDKIVGLSPYPKTSCWPLRAWGWVPAGAASTALQTGARNSAGCSACRKG